MKKIDYILQKERIKQAKKYIAGDTILDIGCHYGELFEYLLRFRKINGNGIDSVLKTQIDKPQYSLHPGFFPDDFKLIKKYDNITLLAVLEHIPLDQLQKYPQILSEYLEKNGRVIITIPSKKVDYILKILLFLKLIDGMDLEHHQDFERDIIKTIFCNNGYRLLCERRFELGLNILYVFEKL